MKRTLLVAAFLAVFFGIPMTVKAVVVGTNTIALDGTTGAGWVMSELNGARITDLSTLIENASDTVFFRRGGIIYFPTADGIAKQTIGKTTSSLVKKTKNFSITAAQKSLFIISDTSTSKTTKGSYLYNISTKKSSIFTPKIGKLTQAQIAPDGKWLALLTKSATNKPLLYVSAMGELQKLKAIKLPKNATACTALAIAPDNASIAVVCAFTQDDNSSAAGILFGVYANGAVKLAAKPYYDSGFSMSTIVWTTSQKLVSGGFGLSSSASALAENILSHEGSVRILSTPTIVSALHAYTVKNLKVTKRTVREIDTSAISTDPSTLILTLQLTKVDANTVMFMSFVITTDAEGKATEASTYIGSYNLQTSTHNILLKNGKVNVLGETPVVSS